MTKKKIIIIGAGPGGLTTGMILAHRGFEVTLFEAKEEVGGRNAAIKTEGYTFDTGPTFLMMNFVLKEMFEETGRQIEDYLSFKKLDPMYELQFDDRRMLISDDHTKMRQEIHDKFPGNESGLDQFLEYEKKRYEYLFPCIQKDYSTIWSLVSPILMKALPYLSPGKSIFQNLGRYFKEDKLKLSFTFQSKYLGMSPWKCPAFFTMLPFVEHQFGIYHVMGGLNQISHAMKRVIEEEGGKIKTSTPVDSLLIENKKVKGVRLKTGEDVLADEVVINADFGYAMTHLIKEGTLKKYSPKKVEKKEYSCSTFMIYLGVKKKYPMKHHTIIFAKDYKTNVEHVFGGKKLDEDMSFYIHNASVTDPSLAPEGKSTIYILVPVPNQFANIDWEKEKESFKEKVLKLVEEKTIIKDLREQIEVEHVITPNEWEKELNVFKGATFNLAHTFPQLLYLRPRNRFEELKNCFLVGGGTHPGSGLPTIYESARISSNLICKKHKTTFPKPSHLAAKSTVSS
ncbi:phytoene desaturase [bacterium F11]|nr:phytoene desaturase [bacterium F11]